MKSLRLFAVIVFMAVLILAGCDAQPAAGGETPATLEQKNSAIIYEGQDQNKVLLYLVKDGFLVPVTLGVEPTKEPVKAALDILFSGLTPEAFQNKLSGVRLNSFSVAGDTVSVDLSADFLKDDERKTREEQLIFTLTEFDDIKKVKISIDGKTLNDAYERPALINRVDWPQKAASSKNAGVASAGDSQIDENYLTVYYVDRTKKYIIPISFSSPKIQLKTDEKIGVIPPDTEEKAKAAVEHLIEGPEGIEGLKGIFPAEVKLKDFYIKDGIAYVDVSRDLITSFAKDAQYEEVAVESVVQTLTSIDEIEKVQFLVDGNRMGSIAGHTNITYPISRLKWYNIIE
ncbi:MAG: GerMN domain-containing protein [Tepidanaerobacteraceae bacterium]|nr:GerMN domain-containing protein [Tepidanaerobacteraceae bacterium]